jgi:hypothetical protein
MKSRRLKGIKEWHTNEKFIQNFCLKTIPLGSLIYRFKDNVAMDLIKLR